MSLPYLGKNISKYIADFLYFLWKPFPSCFVISGLLLKPILFPQSKTLTTSSASWPQRPQCMHRSGTKKSSGKILHSCIKCLICVLFLPSKRSLWDIKLFFTHICLSENFGRTAIFVLKTSWFIEQLLGVEHSFPPRYKFVPTIVHFARFL